MIFRSKHPLGPYEEPPAGVNPLVHNSPDDPHVRQTGHADLVQAENGDWWGVLLATRRQVGNTEQLGRETFFVPVEWPEGGWPTFNNGQAVGLTVLSDDLPQLTTGLDWRDDFTKGKLRMRRCREADIGSRATAWVVSPPNTLSAMLRPRTRPTRSVRKCIYGRHARITSHASPQADVIYPNLDDPGIIRIRDQHP